MNSECAAVSEFALDGDLSVMGLDDVLDDREAETGAFDVVDHARADAVELLENPFLLLASDADTTIFHRDRGESVAFADPQYDFFGAFRILDGVVEQIGQGDQYRVVINQDRRQRSIGRFKRDTVAALLQSQLADLQHLGDHRAQVREYELIALPA